MIDTFVLQGPVPGRYWNHRRSREIYQEPNRDLWINWLGVARAISYEVGHPELTLAEASTWNQKISASLLCDVSHLELAVRNLTDKALQARVNASGPDEHWLQDRSGYFSRIGGREFIDLVKQARFRALREKASPSWDDIVAELSLGFWLSFLGKKYLALHGDLASTYLVLGDRNIRRLRPVADRFRSLRNRVAHHHRIIHRELLLDWELLLEMAGFIHPSLRVHLEKTSETPKLILGFSQIAQARSLPNLHEPR